MSSSPSQSTEQISLHNLRTQLAEIAQVFAVGAIIILVGIRFSGDNPLAGQVVIWLAYASMIAVIHAALRRRGQGWSHLGLTFSGLSWPSFRRALWQSLLVLVAAVAAFVLGSLIGAPLFGLPEQADYSRYNPLRGNLLLLLITLPSVWLVSSVGEEIVFRGFLITRVAEFWSRGKSAWGVAVVVSAVMFGLVHYAWGPTGIVQTTFMGLALGVAYGWVRRNLWVTILTHLYMDTMLLIPLYFAEASSSGS